MAQSCSVRLHDDTYGLPQQHRMGHMRQILGRIGFAALALALMVSTHAFAQEETGGAAGAGASGDQAPIQDAAKKAYQAISDSKIDDLWVLVQGKYDRKLRPERLRPMDVGPKVSVAFDGNVKVLRVERRTRSSARISSSPIPRISRLPKSAASTSTWSMTTAVGKSARPTKKKPASTVTWADGITRAHSPSAPTRGWCFCPITSAARRIATRPQLCRW